MFFSMLRNRANTVQPGDQTESNIRNFYYEIVFASIMGAVITFNAAFAIRLGASDELVALLSSVPALVAAIGSIPSARFLQSRQKRKRWVFGSLLVLRIGYGLVIFLPSLFPFKSAAVWLIGWIIILNLPSIFFTNGFHDILALLIPEQRRTTVFSRRSIIYSIGLVIVSALIGVLLDHVAFPLNYQLMYAVGVIASLISSFFLNRIKVPDRDLDVAQPTRRNINLIDRDNLNVPIAKAQMTQPIFRLLFNLTIYQLGLTIPAALFSIYYIENLKATDGWLGINGAAGSAGVILGYLIWERLIRRRSYSWAIRRAPLFTGVFPAAVALAPVNVAFLIIPIFNVIVNMIHPAFDLSSLNIMMKLSDERVRTVYMSWFNMMVNVSTFIGPLVGVGIARVIGIPATMLIAAFIRLLGGTLFNVNPVVIPITKQQAH